MDVSDLLLRARRTLERATELDRKRKFKEAVDEYTLAFEYYLVGLRYLKEPTVKNKIRASLVPFFDRAETIKQVVEKERGQTPQSEKKTTIPPETNKLRESLKDTIVIEKPNVSLDEVIGLEPAKQALHEAIILPQKFPNLFVGKRKPWKGILLYGPPGTGNAIFVVVMLMRDRQDSPGKSSEHNIKCDFLFRFLRELCSCIR
jgi:vacuolar protein-sorting-associated protein 4